MLTIKIPETEFYNETINEFISVKEQTIQLEHSLVSLSKWESKWHKPFSTKEEKTPEEFIDYIRCMTITQNVKPYVYKFLSDQNIKEILDYIGDPMTATTISKNVERPSREVVTSEIIYYWMIALGIPFECQKWHLNRLITLIKVCSIKSQPPKKMSRKDTAKSNASLNAARRKALHSRG